MKLLYTIRRSKYITIFLVLLFSASFAGAQTTLDTVFIINKAKRFSPSQHILLMFEVLDTVDASGKKTTMSRSYFFDKNNRTISSVREYYNPKKPRKGKQVIYSYGANKLASVTVVPPRSECRNCESRYFFTNDTIVSKQENSSSKINPSIFASQALFFQAKLPQDLPWGYFNDEVIVNGKKKRIKNY